MKFIKEKIFNILLGIIAAVAVIYFTYSGIMSLLPKIVENLKINL